MPTSLPSLRLKGNYTPPYSILAMAKYRARLDISLSELAEHADKSKGSGVNSKMAIYRLESGIYGVGSTRKGRESIISKYSEALIKAIKARSARGHPVGGTDVARAYRVCEIAASGRFEAIDEMLYSTPLDAEPSTNPIPYYKNRWDGILAATEASAECRWIETYMCPAILQSDRYLKDALATNGKSKADSAIHKPYLDYHEKLRKLVNSRDPENLQTDHRVLLSETAFVFQVWKSEQTKKEQAEILIDAARGNIPGLVLRIFDEKSYRDCGHMPMATVALFDALLAIHDLEDDIDATVDPVRVIKYWNRFDTLWQVASEKEAAVKIISKRLR